MSSFANLILNVTGNSADAQRALREVREELRTMASEQYRAQIDVAGTAEAQAKLNGLEQSLTVIGTRAVTAKVRVDVDSARAQLKALRAELELAERGGAGARRPGDILGDIGRVGSDIDNIGKRTGLLRGTLSSVGEVGKTAFNGLIRGIGSVISIVPGLARIGGNLTGIASGAAGAGAAAASMAAQMFILLGVFLVMIPAIVALVGVLGALAASLAFALGGLAVLTVALGAALLPILAVVVAGIVKLVQAGKAAEEQNRKEAAAADAVKTAREGLTAASSRVADATRNVEQAQAGVQAAATAAWGAYADAVERVSDGLLDVQSAQLGVQEANLAVDQTAQALKDALAEAGLGGAELDETFKKFTDVDFKGGNVGPTLKKVGAGSSELDIRAAVLANQRALLNQKKAIDGVSDARKKLTEDQSEVAGYLREGISFNDQYTAAVQRLEDAERSRNIALREQDEAQRKVNVALRKQADVIEEYDEATKKLGERFDVIKKKIAAVFSPIGARVGNAAFDTLEKFIGLVDDPGIAAGLDDITDALVDFLRELGDAATSEEGRNLFRSLTTGAGRLTRALGSRIFLNFLRIMGRIAKEALPALLEGAEKIGGAFEGWERGSRASGRLRSRVDRLVDAFKDWMGLIKAVGRVLLAFFDDGEEKGKNLVRQLTRILNRLARFLESEEGREAVKQWLQDSITFAEKFGEALLVVIGYARDLLRIAAEAIETYNKAKTFVEDTYDALPGGGATRRQQASEQARILTDSQIPAVVERLNNARTGEGRAKQQDLLETLLSRLRKALIRANGQKGGVEVYNDIVAGLGVRSSRLDGLRRAWGGLIPGTGGFGDGTPLLAEGGEYMVRRSVVQNLGTSFFDRLNAGVPPGRIGARGGAAGGGGIHIDKIILPPAPAAAVPDARYQAVQLGRELTRRGG